MEIFKEGREMKLISAHDMDKWGFIAKEQGESLWVKNKEDSANSAWLDSCWR